MISFNNIPDTIRTPGTYLEIDNSRALQGLFANPHKALLVGQKITAGTTPAETLVSITSDGLADGFFGPGSMLARMCNVFKANNPNTELKAIALSDAAGAVKGSGAIQFSIAMSDAGGSMSGTATYYLLVAGKKCYTTLNSGWSVTDVNSAVQATINADSTLPITGSTNATSALNLIAVNGGTLGNFVDVRANFYMGQSDPVGWGDSATITGMAGGTGDPDLEDAWSVLGEEQFHYIGQPYTDADNLTSIEGLLEDRFGPLVDLQGHGFSAASKSLADSSTLGNSRNSPHNSIITSYNSPTPSEEWMGALCAIAAFNLNQDPARPLHYLKLKDILAPAEGDRFIRSERDILLYDGIATWITDTVGNVLIERCATTYQTNAAGVPDASYLDVQTLATLSEIRYQYKSRMLTRFIVPRFKLADDTFPVQPGTNVATPNTVKDETVALFAQLRDAGLVENLDDFITNLIVERDESDRNRVNVLLPPDLINQFRILAGLIQFIL